MFGQTFQGSFATSTGSNVGSQYRGLNKQFQPTGMVQSAYRQDQTFGGYNQAASQYGVQNAQQFHTANYRGNQAGHDAYLRADSQSPSNVQAGIGSSYGSSFGANNYATSVPVQGWTGSSSGSAGWGSTSQYGAQGAQQFHTSNYQGNQPGHDAYLRADSQSPTNYSSGYSQKSYATSAPISGTIGATNYGSYSTQSSIGQQPYQTANYQGNQFGGFRQF